MLLSTECNLRIFRFWRASFCYNTYSFRTLYGYYNVCIHTGIWICGRSDRYGTFASQYLFYIPVWLYSMEQEWIMSSEIWKNKGLIFGKISMYLRRMMFAFLLYFLGILVECFVNPWIISKILEYIKIFWMIYLLYLVLVVIKSPRYSISCWKGLKYRALRQKRVWFYVK